jgi:serine/threonine protein kinase/WD40 repeat protein
MSRVPPRHPDEVPESFGRYRLVKLLGKGGMGSVYLAHDPQLDRSVALKVPQLSGTESASVVARFTTEARAAAALHHPNICPIHEVGEVDGVPYLVMAFVEGKPLGEYAALRPLSPRQSAALVRKLALALDEAHRRGVVHRDLKPANIMIDKRGEPIIMDFGLARRARAGDPRLTQDGACMGTPAYMPPEQIKGEIDAMGPASDIYSLGVILYELLARRLPFSGDVMALLARVVTEEPPPPSQFCPDLDPELEAICLTAMAKKIEDRHGSMAELAAALLQYLRGSTGATLGQEPAKEAKTAPPAARSNPRKDPSTQPEGIRVSQMGGLRSMAMAQAQLPTPRTPSTEKPRPRKSKRARRRGFPAWGWLVAGGGGVAVVLLAGLWAAGVFRAGPRADSGPPPQFASQTRADADPKPPPAPANQDSEKSKLPSPGVVGLWEHTVKAKNINQRIELLSNGRVTGSRNGLPATWALEGSTLTLTWGEKGTLGNGIWRDVCTIAPDGMSYTGRDLQDNLVEGKRIGSADTTGPAEKPPLQSESVKPADLPNAVALFNGKDLKGWTLHSGKLADWTVADGILTTRSTSRGWLMSDTEFDDFELRLEYRVSAKGNSGVTFRATMNGDATKNNLEVQILDDAGYPNQRFDHYTGSIFGIVPPGRRASRPVGEWNEMRISARKSKVTVVINGAKVIDGDLNYYKQNSNHPGLTRARGHIGLQSWEGTTSFRNIWIQPISGTPPEEKSSPEEKVDRGEQLHLIRICDGGIWPVNISTDSRTVLVSSGPAPGRTRLLDLQTGKDVALPMYGYMSGFATGRSELIAGSNERPRNLQVYDLGGNLRRVLPLKDQLWNLFVSPRGDRVVYPSPGGDRLIDTLTGKEIKRWPRGKQDSQFSGFSTDGKLVLFRADPKEPTPEIVRSADTGAELKGLEPQKASWFRGYYPDGRKMTTWTGEPDGRYVRCFAVDGGREIGKVNIRTLGAKRWKLSPDGKRILIFHDDRNVRVWDFTTGKELTAFPAFKLDKITGFDISPDNKYACAGGEPGWFYIWRLPEPN